MSGNASVPAGFGWLSPLEAALHAALIETGRDGRAELVGGADAQAGTSIRATFLRWVIVKAAASEGLSPTGVVIRDAAIAGKLSLAKLQLGMSLSFERCEFWSEVDFSDAALPGLSFTDCIGTGIYADRVKVAGALVIWASPSLHPARDARSRFDWLRLNGACVGGNLDLRGSTFLGRPGRDGGRLAIHADGLKVRGSALLREGFRAAGELRLNGTSIERNLDCSGATLSNPGGYTLSAAGAHIAGTLYVSRSKPGHVCLRSRRFTSRGCLRLEGARIDGDLDANGGRFVAGVFDAASGVRPSEQETELYAIEASGLTVGANMFLGPKFVAMGCVSAINARIGGDLNCRHARLRFPGGEALRADGIDVQGTTFLDYVRTNGVLRLVHGAFRQGLYVSYAHFHLADPTPPWLEDTSMVATELGRPACGILANYAEVGGAFIWRKPRCTPNQGTEGRPLWLALSNSRAAVVYDDNDRENWRRLDRLAIRDCSYTGINDLSADIGWRVDILDREYAVLNSIDVKVPPQVLAAAMARFNPQPYMQLAKVVRAAGLEAAANEVLVRLEQNRTRYGGYGFWGLVGRHILDKGLRYGFAIFRPVYILLIWALISAVVFQAGYSGQRIIASKDNRAEPMTDKGRQTTLPARPLVSFNALVYSLDTLVPLVDLNQKKNWLAEPLSANSVALANDRITLPHISAIGSDPMGFASGVATAIWQLLVRVALTVPDRAVSLLVIFNSFFGWALTTLLATGVTGLLHRDQDDQ